MFYTYGDTLTGIDAKNRRRKAAKVVVLSVFILAKSSTMSYAYEKGIGNPSGQQPLIEGAATAATVVAPIDPASKIALVMCGVYLGWAFAQLYP
jgi:hypothetical protein